MLANKQEIIFFSALGGILLILLGLIYFAGYQLKPLEATFNIGSPQPLMDINITAKAAYVLDSRTGKVLYSKNEDTRLPLASLAKVMSALVASQLASEDTNIVISDEAIKAEGDAGLLVGEKWRLKDLIDFSLVSSANDGMAAIALSFGDFVSQMNKEADKLGMANTYFFNETGLDEAVDKSGAYGSAKDMVTLFDYILKNRPTLLSATKETEVTFFSLNGLAHIARNTDTIIHLVPSVIASKTGTTILAGGNLILAFDPEIGRPIIIALLGSTESGRFEDMLILVRASMESVRNSVKSRR